MQESRQVSPANDDRLCNSLSQRRRQSSWRPGTAQFCTACYDRYIKLLDDFELPSTCDVSIQCDLLPPTADVLTDTEIVETSPVFISLSPKRRRNETSCDASQPPGSATRLEFWRKCCMIGRLFAYGASHLKAGKIFVSIQT
jgi:hypothetical protein